MNCTCIRTAPNDATAFRSLTDAEPMLVWELHTKKLPDTHAAPKDQKPPYVSLVWQLLRVGHQVGVRDDHRLSADCSPSRTVRSTKA
jgi:hypothetical protein